MKVWLNIALLALWSALPETAATSSVADDFCLAKQRQGYSTGTVYSLSDTCQICACDGALRKFCTSDPACKRKKQEEYDAMHRRPCYKGGSKYQYGSQVQQDCNICRCENATWSCSTQNCGYDGSEEEKKQDTTEDSNETTDHEAAADCEDVDGRCSNWVKKRGRSVCSNNNYVKKKCHRSCDNCPKEVEEVEEVEVCEDSNKNCPDWARRPMHCETKRYMRAKCKLSCNICTVKEEIVTEEDTEEEEEETVQDTDEEERREKTAEELAVEAWRARLLEEGKLIDTTKTPLGCRFSCEGTVYPWGSALQDSYCGICTCKKRSQLDYYFRCTNRECETTCTET